MRTLLGLACNLLGAALLCLFFAVGCGGLLVDVRDADRVIHDWMGR